MKAIFSVGGIFALFFAALSSSPCFAEPDLFIDGTALADHVTVPLLENPGGRSKETPTPARRLLLDLYQGSTAGMDVDTAAGLLHDWLLQQPDRSVQPDALFQRAFELCANRVQRGLMTVWSVLRQDWQNKDRNNFSHIKKLVDITGEAEAFQKNDIQVVDRRGRPREAKTIRGDNFSAWYHMTGTALLAYTLAATGRPFPKLITSAMIELEERVYYDEFIDPFKRRFIDYQGMHFGARLAQNLREFDKAEAFLAARPLTPILYRDSSKMPGDWPLLPGETSGDYFQRKPRNLCYLSFKGVAAHTVLSSKTASLAGIVTLGAVLTRAIIKENRRLTAPETAAREPRRDEGEPVSELR